MVRCEWNSSQNEKISSAIKTFVWAEMRKIYFFSFVTLSLLQCIVKLKIEVKYGFKYWKPIHWFCFSWFVFAVWTKEIWSQRTFYLMMRCTFRLRTLALPRFSTSPLQKVQLMKFWWSSSVISVNQTTIQRIICSHPIKYSHPSPYIGLAGLR